MKDHGEIRVCGVADYMLATDCKWNKKEITWTIQSYPSNFSKQQIAEICLTAWSYWTEVCGLVPIYVEDSSEAMIVINMGEIDGPSNVLAWSEMPCTDEQVHQKYDSSEHWIVSDCPTNGIDIVRVVAHEIGHGIGIPHIGRGNLMAPIYDPKIRKPQKGDIEEAISRYGESASKPLSWWHKIIKLILDKLSILIR
jgi:hypothetical protein